MTEQLQALLASIKKPRKVRTPAGAKRYGQPIGTIIVPGGKILKVGDKGYDAADKQMSGATQRKPKARITKDIASAGVDFSSLSDEEAIKEFETARDLVNNDKGQDPAAFSETFDRAANLRKELRSRNIDPNNPRKVVSARATEIQLRAKKLGTQKASVSKFRKDTPEQRAADEQMKKTRDMVLRGQSPNHNPLSLAESRLMKNEDNPSLDDSEGMKAPLDQPEDADRHVRTEHQEVRPTDFTWEMLPQIADYASSVESKTNTDDVDYYLKSHGADQVRSHLSGTPARAKLEQVEKTIRALDLLTSMDLPDNVTLFRGMSVPSGSDIANLAPGDTFTDPSFISTSVKRSEAIFFSRMKSDEINDQKIIFEIETAPGLHGAPMYAVAARGLEEYSLINKTYGDEYEVLLKRNTTFEVSEVSDSNRGRIIRLKPKTSDGNDIY